MALRDLVEEATAHFLRSQFVESLSKLQDAMGTEPSKMSVILQCLLANNIILCESQLTGKSITPPDLGSFKEVMLSLRGVLASQNRAVVDCIIQYNQLIAHLQESTDSRVEANAASVAHTIQEYLSAEILQTLDSAVIPLVVMRCALLAVKILAGLDITDWQIHGQNHSCHKESWCTAMMLPTGCKVLTASDDPTAGDSLSLEGILKIMECVKACQDRSWQRALKIIKHSRKSWRGILAVEMKYVKAFCYYQLASFEAAQRCLSSFPSESSRSLKVKVHQLLACCLAKQGKYHLAIMEFNRVLSGVSHDSLLLPLLNLSVLFGRLGNQDTELAILDQLVKVSSEPLEQVDCPCLRFHPDRCPQPSATEMHIKALFCIAHRSLQLQRFEEASERYLDLISLLEETSVIRLGSSEIFPGTIPSIPQIFLEAASSLLRAGRYEEAEAICDTIITRTRGPKVTNGATAHSRGDSLEGCDHSAGVGVDTSNTRETDKLDRVHSGGISCELDSSVAQERLGSNRRHMNQSDYEIRTLASLCLIRSECLLKLRDLEGSLESLDDALLVLDRCPYGDQLDPESLPHSTAKRRKLKSDGTRTDTADCPADGVSSLRGRAYNNKALILIGRGRLNDAHTAVLSSLEYDPGNADARRNLCLLLFKLGRKKEAYAEWRELSISSP